MEYDWKYGSRISGNASVVGGQIESIRQKKGGFVGARDVLQSAKRKTSPLHEYFEWDDGLAADEYRLVQARELLRAIVIVREDVTVRGFVNVQIEDDLTYTSIDFALSDAELRLQVINKAKKEMISWHQRYKDLVEFNPIHEAIARFAD